MKRAIILMPVLLALATPALAAHSEREDDAVCRSYVKNKSPTDPGTYESCRKDLVYMDNNPVAPAPAPAAGNDGGQVSCFSTTLPGGMVQTTCH